MQLKNLNQTKSVSRHWPLKTLLLAISCGLLMMAQGVMAQLIVQDIKLSPVREVTLHAVVDAPKQAVRPAVRQAEPIRSVDNGRPATQAKSATSSEGRGTVHFSEWLKDNPDSARRRAIGSVPESEIRSILVGAVDRAIGRSPLLRQTQAEQAAAAADVREAEGQRWPQIDVGANSKPTFLGGGGNHNNTAQAINLNMTTNVFDWGRTSNTITSREELNSAASQKYLVDLESLARDVSLNVVELEKNRRVSAISKQYVERMNILVSMLKEIVFTDRGRSSELTQARARLMEAQASLDASLARERDNEIKLRKLIGDMPLWFPENDNWALVSVDLNYLLTAMHKHPALRQAEHAANASEHYAKSLSAAEKPQVNWVVTKTTAKDQLDKEQPWQTMVTVNWPLFRGGAASAARQAAIMRAQAEREHKYQQQLDLEFEIRTAEQEANTLLARADLYRDLTKESDDVRKAFFEQWYHLGRRTLLDVLIAESDHNNNVINEVSNRFDGYQSVLKAYASAGQLTEWLRSVR
ncbi:TolC family protein [Aeromonas hydrophila]